MTVPPPTLPRLVVVNTPFCTPQSMMSALRRAYPKDRLGHFYSKQFGAELDLDDFTAFTRAQIEGRFDCLMAHATLSAYEEKVSLAPDGEWRAVMILRHPLERLATAFADLLADPEHPTVRQLGRIPDFDEFVREAKPSNGQCRYAAAVPTFAVASRTLLEKGVLFCPYEEASELLGLLPGLDQAAGWVQAAAAAARAPLPVERLGLPSSTVAWLANRVAEDILLYLWARDRWRRACYRSMAANLGDPMFHPSHVVPNGVPR